MQPQQLAKQRLISHHQASAVFADDANMPKNPL
jgi:hypothetical protein